MAEAGTLQWGVVVCVSLLAAIWDLKSRRIPNSLTLPLIVGGLLGGGWRAGLPGLGDAALGCIVAAGPYVLLFLVAGGGAGDAKMMGGVGAWLGLRDGVVALVAVAVTGGVVGLVKLIVRRDGGSLGKGVLAQLYVLLIVACSGREAWALLEDKPEQRKDGQDPGAPMAYGPAIFVGVCIGAGVVHLWQG
jgi:Flp pilus assembly protein protease CpaA